jgi:membrane protein DedA with SNARE-associated domain
VLSGVIEAIAKYSIEGVFVVSFIGNVIPYSAIPYLAFVAAYAVAVPTTSKVEIAISGGVGAALGKIVLYLAAKYAGKKLSEKKREELSSFKTLFQRKHLDLILIYLFAALPLPDDVLYFPLGVSGYNLTKFVVAVVAGKITLVGLTALWGEQVGWLIRSGVNVLPAPLLIFILLRLNLPTLQFFVIGFHSLNLCAMCKCHLYYL